MALALTKRCEFIKQFHAQNDTSNIVCFPFWELVAAAGCPYRCSYCFLQATPSYVFRHYPLSGAVFTNWADMLEEVDRWLKHPIARVLVVGELQDGLAFEGAYRRLAGRSLAEMLIPRFAAQEKHVLLFLTKSTGTRFAERLASSPQSIFSWSVNTDYAARRWEKGAPSPARRFLAAERMQNLGWRIRFRLDPMIPYSGWQNDYARTINQVNALHPEMVTIGALRASNTLRAHARRNGRDDSIFDFLKEKDPSGFKWRVPFEEQIKMFRFAIERLDPAIRVALCKEDASVWQSVGLVFKGCHCLMATNECLIRDQGRIEKGTFLRLTAGQPDFMMECTEGNAENEMRHGHISRRLRG